jgi:hypothetical protein
VDALDHCREFLGLFQLQEGGLAGGVESLLQSEAFFQERQRFAGFSQMFSCRGQEIKRSPAVWQSGLEFLHGRNLVADFLGIGRLGGRALNFFLIL